ncbi:hypothetical protein HPB50_008719 [Hyalomma asiaticum]|uniref:Uncharacterized protein n=1 Tax=Hyalomma asiaticum TaxID=266040 RepID=A0ACB7TF84_HYAAI|nr:hypothetical protein HPB50_008719 [Hyalomma asiaticum]
MPLVNWSEATPEDLAGFTADFLREELVRRDLDSAGSKEEVINRLIADIAQNRLTTSQLPPPDSAAPSQRPNTTSPPTFDAAQTLHSTLSETLDGSLVQCALVNATIAGIGQVDAFPDSGSKVTLVSRHLVSSLPLLPWTRPPLVVVGGTTVAPAGAICLKISVGPITGLVEAAALDNNAVALVLGEDWFSASRAQLVFQPPMPTEIRHSTTGTSVRCHERLLPVMSNAVMIKGSSFNCHGVTLGQRSLTITLHVSHVKSTTTDNAADSLRRGSLLKLLSVELESLEKSDCRDSRRRKSSVGVNSLRAVQVLLDCGGLRLGTHVSQLIPVARQVASVTCLYLPSFVPDNEVVNSLKSFGTTLKIEGARYKDRPTIRTGTRHIRMDMRSDNPLPNFARVSGHRATFEYRGVRRLCRCCNLEGHIRAQCDTPYCVRCGVFGHRTDTCTAACRRCGGAHASVDCTARKSYSMAAAMEVDEFPTLGRTPATEQSRLTTLRRAK